MKKKTEKNSAAYIWWGTVHRCVPESLSLSLAELTSTVLPVFALESLSDPAVASGSLLYSYLAYGSPQADIAEG
jgi:hypothetical protein